MAKRSEYPRRDRDFYPTPESAVIPLAPHLPTETTAYWEPCAGDGALVRALDTHWGYGTCTRATDIKPQQSWITRQDAFDVSECLTSSINITNPPWPSRRGQPTLDMILHLSAMAPTWMLLSADFAHNAYFKDVAGICDKIVSVGRVSWLENGIRGKDNAAWYRFAKNHIGATRFFGRA